MEIVRFDPSLQAEVFQFFQRMWRELGRTWTLGTDRDLAAIQAVYQNSGGEFWVALRKGSVAGTVGLLPWPTDGVYVLKRYYVLREHQGIGIGTNLLRVALEKAKSNGYDRVWLDTTEGSVAQRLFRQQGFAEVQNLPLGIKAEVYMELKL